MRLDVFLKTSRLIKRRTLAKEYCEEGRVTVGGAPAKPGREVKPGDVLTIELNRRRVVAEIAETPEGNVTKERAATLYRILEDIAKKDELM